MDHTDRPETVRDQGAPQQREQAKPPPLRGLKIMRVAGVDVFINATWLIIFALIAWSLAEGYFPDTLPGRGRALYWGLGLASALLLFVSVLIHELTHSLVARRLGLHVRGITLFLFGGVSDLADSPHNPGSEFKIAVSGPLASFVLAALFFAAFVLVPGPAALIALLGYLAVVNLLLGLFNILPGFPLDGGRVLRSLIWWRTQNLKRSTLMAASAGAGVGWALVAVGVLEALLGRNPLGGAWLVLIGLFLRSAAHWSAERAEQGQEV
jgi:Zn-dependent protease